MKKIFLLVLFASAFSCFTFPQEGIPDDEEETAELLALSLSEENADAMQENTADGIDDASFSENKEEFVSGENQADIESREVFFEEAHSVIQDEKLFFDEDIPSVKILFYSFKEISLKEYSEALTFKKKKFTLYGICKDENSGISEISFYIGDEKIQNVDLKFSSTEISQKQMKSSGRFSKWRRNSDFTDSITYTDSRKQLVWIADITIEEPVSGELSVVSLDKCGNKNIINACRIFIKPLKTDLYGVTVTPFVIFLRILGLVLVFAVSFLIFNSNGNEELSTSITISAVLSCAAVLLWLIIGLIVKLLRTTFTAIAGHWKTLTFISIIILGAGLFIFLIYRFVADGHLKNLLDSISSLLRASSNARIMKKNLKQQEKARKQQERKNKKYRMEQKKLSNQQLKQQNEALKKDNQVRLENKKLEELKSAANIVDDFYQTIKDFEKDAMEDDSDMLDTLSEIEELILEIYSNSDILDKGLRKKLSICKMNFRQNVSFLIKKHKEDEEISILKNHISNILEIFKTLKC